MNKFLKRVFSLMIGAALATAAVPASVQAYAASEIDSENSGLTLSPVISSYGIYTVKDGKAITSLSASTVFNMKITIKDIKVKTSELRSADDIDFLKNIDAFRGTVNEVKILSSGDEFLRYEISLRDCRWTGGETTFGFMVGYTGGSDYANCSFTVSECTSSVPSVPDDPAAEPIIRIKGIEPSAPIKAGETGEFKISLKNLGSTDPYNILAEISPAEDILIIDGTGTQEVSSLDYNGEKIITVKYRALEKINSLRQSFNVSLRYYYENGMSEASGSASAQITVAAEISTVEKVFPVINAEFSLAETELEAGKDYSGTVTIKNIGTADIKGLFVNFSGSDDIVILGGTGSRFFSSLPINGKQQILVKFRTMKEITSPRQLLNYALKYTYVTGGDEVDGSYEGSFLMFGKEKTPSEPPLPIITSEPFENPLEAGKSYRKAFCITNKGSADMQNITVRIKSSDGLTITNGKDSFFVDSIKAGGEKRILVYFNTNAELTSVNQSLDVDIEYYYDKSGEMTSATKSGTITMNSEISAAPVLRLSGEKQESALVPDTEYEYTIGVKNFGEITVRNVFVDFTGTDAFYFLDGTESCFIDIIRPGDTEEVTVKFKTLREITAVKQTISAALNYSYGRNTSILQKESTGSVVLIASPNKEQSSGSSAAPNIIVGRYDIGADQIAAGEVFSLNLDFYNTSADTNIENVVMTVNASGDLSIYGGSSSFYYPSLGAAASVSETVQLRALPTAQTGTSSVSVSFKYDYLSGENRNSVTSEQTIFIPLYQPDKMTFSVNKPSYDIYVGNEAYITLSYLNKGRSDASNVKAELVGDVAALTTEKIIGNVAAGGNGSVDFVVTPYMAGEVTFSIKLTYEDSNMNEVTQEIPVTLNIIEMMWEDPGYYPMTMEEPGTESGGFPWWIVFVGGGVLIVAAVIVIIVVVVHKKKKNGKKLTAEDIDWEDEFDSDTADSSDKTKV